MAAKSAAVLDRLGSELSFKRMDLSGLIVFRVSMCLTSLCVDGKYSAMRSWEKLPRTRLLIINHRSHRDD